MSTSPEQVPIGNARYVFATITDPVSGALVDPDVVLANYQWSNGTPQPLTVTRVSAGLYRVQVTINQLGIMTVWFANTTNYVFDTASSAQFLGVNAGHT